MTVPADVHVTAEVRATYPGVSVAHLAVPVGPAERLAMLAEQIWQEQYRVWVTASRADVLGHPRVAAYRAFTAALGLNPDRQPPSIQSLINRGLQGKPTAKWPHINPVVDLLNAMALRTMTALGAFDADRITGEIRLALTTGGEPFHALGSREEQLGAGRLVLADEARVLSLFARRDGVHQAITSGSRRVLLLGCVVPGVPAQAVYGALIELAGLMLPHAG